MKKGKHLNFKREYLEIAKKEIHSFARSRLSGWRYSHVISSFHLLDHHHHHHHHHVNAYMHCAHSHLCSVHVFNIYPETTISAMSFARLLFSDSPDPNS